MEYNYAITNKKAIIPVNERLFPIRGIITSGDSNARLFYFGRLLSAPGRS